MSGKSLNRVQLIGNLGKPVEVKYTASGTAVASVSIATSSSYKDKQGEWQEKTEWTNLVFWARLAELAGEYLHKGSKVYVEGRLETQSWDDKQTGKKAYKTQVVVSEMIMLDGKNSDNQDRPTTDTRAEAKQSGARPVTAEDPITDDEIPF
jgi:single-strand DNA-binding protein